MDKSIFIALFIGTIAIIQAGLNKTMVNSIGLNWTLFIGSLVTMLISTTMFLLEKKYPNILPHIFKIEGFQFKAWFVVPGILGFLFIFLLPISFQKVGAIKTTVGLIAAQMITSVAWDTFIENISINTPKALGIAMAIGSVLLISLS